MLSPDESTTTEAPRPNRRLILTLPLDAAELAATDAAHKPFAKLMSRTKLIKAALRLGLAAIVADPGVLLPAGGGR